MPYYGTMQPLAPDVNAILATKDQPMGQLLMNLGMADAMSGGKLSGAATGKARADELLKMLAGGGVPGAGGGGGSIGAPVGGGGSLGDLGGGAPLTPDAGGKYSSMLLKMLAGG